MDVKVKSLPTADIIVSNKIGIERKTIQDFVNSIIDKRIFTQLKDLKNNFENPIIILEGKEDIYSVRNIHPNAIRGMLATIVSSFNIPIINTKDSQDTAEFIKILANREQSNNEKEFAINFSKKPMTTKEQQEFIIESLPGIGPSLSKSLLRKFKKVKNIINADINELKKVNKMGPKKAKEIQLILEEIYQD